MKLILENWRNYVNEATEGELSGEEKETWQRLRSYSAPYEGDVRAREPGTPADADPRWGSSDWTGVKGHAVIDPDLLGAEHDDRLLMQQVGKTVAGYLNSLSKWRVKDLEGALWGQRATITHGRTTDASGKGIRGYGIPTFKTKDQRGLFGKLKLPLSWSVMFKAYTEKKKAGLGE